MNFPDTRNLAIAAYAASGHKTHQAFCNEYGCALRSFRRWLAGDSSMDGLTRMTMGQIATFAWHPTLYPVKDDFR